MAVYDCCCFLNENDLYEIRFQEHWDFVDKFIIIEAGETHTGLKKPFKFDHKRFQKYSSKIVYVKFDSFEEEMKKYPELLDADALVQRGGNQVSIDWTRGHFQANYIWKVLQDIGAQDTDLAYVSCADEILKKEAWYTAAERFKTDFRDQNGYRPIFGFHYYLYAYKMNLLHRHWTQHVAGQVNEVGSFKQLLPATWRSRGISNHPHIPDAGWHFTFFDPTDGELILEKQRSWSHSRDAYPGRKLKFDHTTKEEAIERFFEDYPVLLVPVTPETHPKTVIDNLDKWDNFFYKP